jgi:hypothetical protein
MSAVLRTPTPPSYAYLDCRERGTTQKRADER